MALPNTACLWYAHGNLAMQPGQVLHSYFGRLAYGRDTPYYYLLPGELFQG